MLHVRAATALLSRRVCHIFLLANVLWDNGVVVGWFRAGRELMIRYKGRAKTSLTERGFPHRVEMIVPKGGFGQRLDKMHEWHRARSIKPRFGRSRRDANNHDYVTWCFADAAMADSFRASFIRS